MDDQSARDAAVELSRDLAAVPDLAGRFALILRRTGTRVVLTTSFGLEDQAMTHAAAQAMAAEAPAATLHLATLDTGRLFPQTHDVWAATEQRYGLRIECVSPAAESLTELVATQGIEGFRASVDNRKACCGVRKVVGLRRVLRGADLWVTGLRADQSATRAPTPFAAWDPEFGVMKVSPLADWSRDAVAAYARAQLVPVNALHAQGFLSIGCAPCTRAVEPGEPERAGRWWWEDESHKECGLHNRPARTGTLEAA